MTIKIKLKITIHAIWPSLRQLLSDGHISDGSDVFRTSKLPNVLLEYVKLVYIYILMLYILEMHFD